jgi:hypothetical protein
VSTPAKSVTARAIILAADARQPDPEAFRQRLAETHAVALDLVGAVMWAVDVDGEPTTVTILPAPIGPEIERAAERAWWWPEAAEVSSSTRAQWIVTAQASDGDVVAANLRLTAIVAALLRSDGALAVYWIDGAVVRSAADFLEHAETATRECLPLPLWIAIAIDPEEGDDDPFFFATTGMTALGFVEIETVLFRDLGGYALDRIFDVAHYLCDKGPILLDGQTFGLDAGERIVISHRPSRRGEGDVIFLEFPKLGDTEA